MSKDMLEKDQRKELSDILSISEPITEFGCVFFDLQETEGKMIPWIGKGWASINGGKAFRINQAEDLDANIKWLTNLSEQNFFKSNAFKKNTLKHSGYLRTEVAQIMKELGLSNNKKYVIADVCEIISGIFSKVMKLSIEFYSLSSFEEKDLASEIKNSLVQRDESVSTPIDEALSRAYQDLVICEKDVTPDKDSVLVTLKRPRLFHAQKILETPIPIKDAKWSFFGKNDLPRTVEERVEFVSGLEKPYIAKINILSFNENEIHLDKLLNLGMSMGENFKPKERNWVSQVEFIYLVKMAQIDIEAVLAADGYEDVPLKSDPLVKLGELSDFSYSLGLLAECVYVGLSSRSVNLQTRRRTLVSPRACWFKSTDRFLSLTSALFLSHAGFKIVSYGTGGVTILLNKADIKKLIEIVPYAGVQMPGYLITEDLFK